MATKKSAVAKASKAVEQVIDKGTAAAIEKVAKAPAGIELVKEGRAVMNSALGYYARALSGPLKPAELATAFSHLRAFSDDVKALDDTAKSAVLAMLKTKGETFGKGSLRLVVGSFELEARPTKTGVDDKRLEALLRAKGVAPEKYMQTTVKFAADEAMTSKAIADGVITADEVQTCVPETTYAVQRPKPA